MSKLFIFGREASQIRERAKAEEREHCETHYLGEQRIMRKQYSEDKEKIRKAHVDELKDLEQSLRKYYTSEIKSLKDELNYKELQLRDSRTAWDLIKGVVPELSNYASVLETKAQARALEKAKDLAVAQEIDQGLESIARKLQRIMPDVSKLLHLDEVPKMIK